MLLDPPLRQQDVVQMKKAHACGGDLWVVLLAGADVRLKCQKCGRVVLLDRVKFNSRLKRRVSVAETEGNP
ncbi:MAG: DUF951 domain-containing protein [Bacillota bacterium]